VGINADDIFNLLLDPFRLSSRQVKRGAGMGLGRGRTKRRSLASESGKRRPTRRRGSDGEAGHRGTMAAHRH